MFVSVGTRHIPVGSIREIRELPGGELEIHRADSGEVHRVCGEFAANCLGGLGITPALKGEGKKVKSETQAPRVKETPPVVEDVTPDPDATEAPDSPAEPAAEEEEKPKKRSRKKADKGEE